MRVENAIVKHMTREQFLARELESFGEQVERNCVARRALAVSPGTAANAVRLRVARVECDRDARSYLALERHCRRHGLLKAGGQAVARRVAEVNCDTIGHRLGVVARMVSK